MKYCTYKGFGSIEAKTFSLVRQVRTFIMVKMVFGLTSLPPVRPSFALSTVLPE